MARKSQSRPKQQQEDKEPTSSVVSPVKAQATVERNMSEVESIIEYEEDLGEAEAPVPIPEGDYPALIRGAAKKMSKGDVPKEYVDVTFFINADQYPPDYTEGDPEGLLLNYGMGRLPTAGDTKSRWRMKKFCEAIGAELGRKLDLNSWLDKPAIVTIKHEEYEGVQQARIVKVAAA